MALTTAIPFVEPTGTGEVLVTPAGDCLKLAIAKRSWTGRHLLLHAALTAADAAAVRDALSAWLADREGAR